MKSELDRVINQLRCDASPFGTTTLRTSQLLALLEGVREGLAEVEKLGEALREAQDACWQVVDDASPHPSGVGASISLDAVEMCRPHAEAVEAREIMPPPEEPQP